MVSNKKSNNALKSKDFLQDLLEDELGKSSSNDGEFFDMLVEEVEGKETPESLAKKLKIVPEGEGHTRTEAKTKVKPEELKPNDYNDKTEVLGDEPVNSKNLEPVSNFGSSTVDRNPLIDLKNVDYIKAAQEKVLRLEKELMSLRHENQELAVAGDHFKSLSDDQKRKIKSLEAEVNSLESTFSEEKEILMESISAKELRVEALQSRVEDLEEQMQTKFNRLRMRERELESRLEIIKQENEAVAHTKDDMLVDLKKQVGSLTEDLERARSQYQKSLDKLSQRDDALRRTAKALKLSLTMLESQKQKD